ncbi:polysaccharide deacetylase family protein [Kiloniella sp. EL199]|uniref:polysaccharide deacetylase family protein n=1 Tax=Kiloniella sp. EL199 TaxID=2107581 RepID=UPI000EA28B70|nr:polysaccharide deacetylase family protein [Kiloniella sp. EL199]
MTAKYQSGHILLYHGVFENIPMGLESRLHNVNPIEFRKQITWLRDQFEIVSLDDFIAAENRQGLAVITFDDAYTDLFTHAIPWLISEKLPSTIFLNSNLIDGGIFWRDKVRLVLSKGLEGAFLRYFSQEKWAQQIRSERFYKDSKKPELNSKLIDQALDDFFAENNFDNELLDLSKVIAKKDDLIVNPLISYGNHSASHYVLSSLSQDQQREEITSCQAWLNSGEYRTTSSFAVPFGGTKDVDVHTFICAKEAKCSAVLMSRQSVNRALQKDPVTQLPIFERYMAPSTLEGLILLSQKLDRIS